MKRQVHPFALCTCLIFGSSRNLWGKSSLGARLRTRKVTGRDASLPAPLLSAFRCWSPVELLGRCPKPHKGRCPLTLQGALPLDPFSRLSWSRFHAPSACSFLALRLSPCLLPQLSVMSLFLAHFPTQNLPNTSSSSFSSTSSPVISASAICACCKSTPAKSTE